MKILIFLFLPLWGFCSVPDTLPAYNVNSFYGSSEVLEQAYFNDLTTTELYLVCECLLDIYLEFNKKELDGEKLYNYLQERNFLLSWYGGLEKVEDQQTKVFKLNKKDFKEILKL